MNRTDNAVGSGSGITVNVCQYGRVLWEWSTTGDLHKNTESSPCLCAHKTNRTTSFNSIVISQKWPANKKHLLAQELEDFVRFDSCVCVKQHTLVQFSQLYFSSGNCLWFRYRKYRLLHVFAYAAYIYGRTHQSD